MDIDQPWMIETAALATLPAAERVCAIPARAAALKHIGCTALPAQRPIGVIKFLPTDFVVEENDPQGECAQVDQVPLFEAGPWGQYVKVRFIKAGVHSTLHAAHELAQLFHVPLDHIHYAGVKDEYAVTAQDIVLEGVSVDQLRAVRDPRFALFPLHATTEPLKHGDLVGNHFTILVRTPRPVQSEWLAQMVQWVNAHGMLNLYGSQRFYEPRCMSHILGRLIFQGKFDEALKSVFILSSQFEPPYIAGVRKRLAGCFGRWEVMHRLLAQFPHSFSVELRALKSMSAGATTLETLNAIGDQVHYWALAYTSYLYNELVSATVIARKPLPEELPLLLSTTKWAWDTYKKQLFRDNTQGYVEHVRNISSIHISKNPKVQTLVHPEHLRAQVVPEGAVFSFDLPKGSYATTLLSYFFHLVTPPPLVSGVSTAMVDVKEALGVGSMQHVQAYFAQEIDAVRIAHTGITQA